MDNVPPILYAEDNENDIELTLTAFKECGLKNRIDVVRDGQEVLDYLNYEGKFAGREKENPLLILLDIKMPKVDGIQALKVIKTNEDWKSIPVVMLTASSMERDRIETYNLGVNGYVVKPVDFLEFIDAVKKIGAFWVYINKTV